MITASRSSCRHQHRCSTSLSSLLHSAFKGNNRLYFLNSDDVFCMLSVSASPLGPVRTYSTGKCMNIHATTSASLFFSTTGGGPGRRKRKAAATFDGSALTAAAEQHRPIIKLRYDISSIIPASCKSARRLTTPQPCDVTLLTSVKLDLVWTWNRNRTTLISSAWNLPACLACLNHSVV